MEQPAEKFCTAITGLSSYCYNKNNYKFRGKKGKRRACIEPGIATTRNHYSNTALTHRTERNEQNCIIIIHYIRDTGNTYVTISILGKSG